MKKAAKNQTLKITVTVTVIAVISIALDTVRKAYLGTGCLFKALLNTACPACGMTRAYRALLKLDFAAAFYYNPAWWTVPVAAATCFLALFDKKRARLYLKIFIIDIAVLLTVWIVRVATGTAV